MLQNMCMQLVKLVEVWIVAMTVVPSLLSHSVVDQIGCNHTIGCDGNAIMYIVTVMSHEVGHRLLGS